MTIPITSKFAAHMNGHASRLFAMLLLTSIITACADDTTTPPPPSISGIIRIVNDNAVDSDINDTNTTPIANDSPDTAQIIPNPGTFGGYVNVAGSGPAGHSQVDGDPSDYYSTHLLVGQVVTLEATPAANTTLLLTLIDRTPSTGSTQTGIDNNGTQTITVTQQANYYILVQAISGAANYVINITLPTSVAAASTATAPITDNLDVNSDFVPGEVIVKFRQEATIQSTPSSSGTIVKKAASLGLVKKAGAASRAMLMSIDDITNGNLTFKAQSITPNTQTPDVTIRQQKQKTIDTIRSLRLRDDVIEARPNYLRKAFANPVDTRYNLQWHYPMIKLPAAWDITKGSPEVTVAVIDTGVVLKHRDLQGKLVAGYDFIRNNANSADNEPGIDNNPDDVGDNPGQSSFHGTHVAGTIGANTNNNLDVAGVGWNVKVMPLRVLGRDGGTDYDIEQAILFASGVDNDSGTFPTKKADVINLSLGGAGAINTVPDAYKIARENNVIVIAAAGNASTSQPVPYTSYPAAIDGVVAVGAVDIFKVVTTYSNYGSFLDIAAPGGNFSTNDGNGDGYPDGVLSTSASDADLSLGIVDKMAFSTGTSMAAPHIAGVAALMKSIYPNLTPSQFDTLLTNGLLTDDLGTAGRDDKYGYGLIDALKAVTQASNLASGSTLNLPAKASIYPTTLNFGSANPILPFTVSNIGTEALAVTGITHDGEPWLTSSELSVDQNGLGEYQITVDRSSLTNGQYFATVVVTTTAGPVSMSVYMQVKPANLVNSVGQQYVTLKNIDSGDVIPLVATRIRNNPYQFSFFNVMPGRYNIESSTDLDNSQTSCDPGEACARDLDNIGQPETYVITSTSGTYPSLNLLTGFKLSNISSINSANNINQQHQIPLQ